MWLRALLGRLPESARPPGWRIARRERVHGRLVHDIHHSWLLLQRRVFRRDVGALWALRLCLARAPSCLRSKIRTSAAPLGPSQATRQRLYLPNSCCPAPALSDGHHQKFSVSAQVRCGSRSGMQSERLLRAPDVRPEDRHLYGRRCLLCRALPTVNGESTTVRRDAGQASFFR